MTNEEAARILGKRIRDQGLIRVQPASPEALGDFISERNKCHENVDRWIRQHPADARIVGWLATDLGLGQGYQLDRHSIAKTPTRLVDITPMSDRSERLFLPDAPGDDWGNINQIQVTVGDSSAEASIEPFSDWTPLDHHDEPQEF